MFYVLVPDQWTNIPVLVKIYKLLINELSNQIESNMSTQGIVGDDNDEVSLIQSFLNCRVYSPLLTIQPLPFDFAFVQCVV